MRGCNSGSPEAIGRANGLRSILSNAMTEALVTLSERAARRIVEIVADEPENKLLRVSVEGGG